MTLILAVTTPEISLLLADARLTATNAMLVSKSFDCCQKVFRLSTSTLFAFAGDIKPAAELMATMASLYQQLGEERFNDICSIQELARQHVLQHKSLVEGFRLEDGQLPTVEFIYSGRARSHLSLFQTFRVTLPRCECELVTQHGVRVFGSGRSFFAPIAETLEGSLQRMRETAAKQHDPAHYLASSIAAKVQLTLHGRAIRSAQKGEPRDDTFGLMLHGMYVDKEHVTPIVGGSSGVLSFDDGKPSKLPLSAGFEVKYKNDRFFLHTNDGESTEMVAPIEYLIRRNEIRRYARPIDPHPTC